MSKISLNKAPVLVGRALSLTVVFTFIDAGIGAGNLFGQAGLRESLERLDRNENKVIEPDEITTLARPYLERITEEQRLRLDKPIEINRLLESARIYYALKNGVSGKDVRPEGRSSVKPFGALDDEPIVPEFGLAEVKFPYIQDDLDEADRTLGRWDRNEDDYLDQREVARAKWTHRNPYADDLNEDFRLSRLELAQRYARRRLLRGDSKELVQKAVRTGGEIRKSDGKSNRQDQTQWWKKGGDSHWLTAALMSRFDKNRNGKLEYREALPTGISVTSIDIDRDGEITREELFAHVAKMQEEEGDLTEGLPGWFYEMDADRDGQIEMAEFATEWTDEKYREFESLDKNSDGLLTENELLSSKAVTGGTYQNEDAQILAPRRTIISEIEVTDTYDIRRLQLQLSITHSNVSFLDGYLTGPDGQRVELFSEIGGSGNHFEQTIFDDRAGTPIRKASPPYEGSFQPTAIEKRQPGLTSFEGKNVKGVWQLVIRGTRNERFGMLNSWGLTIVPKEDTTIGAAVESEGAGEIDSSESSAPTDSLQIPAEKGIKQLIDLVK